MIGLSCARFLCQSRIGFELKLCVCVFFFSSIHIHFISCLFYSFSLTLTRIVVVVVSEQNVREENVSPIEDRVRERKEIKQTI